MSKSVGDAEIAGLLGGSPSQENISQMTIDWNTADIERAIAQVPNHAGSRQMGSSWYPNLRMIREEKAVIERHDEAEAAAQRRHADGRAEDQRRHADLVQRLDELKKPHWSVVPNFWIALLAAVAAMLAAYFGWLAVRK